MRLATGNIKMAVSSIRAARWRSRLTMLGIIIGVTSVVTIVSIGQGIKSQVTTQVNHLGKDLLTIRPGTFNPSTSGTFQSLAGVANPSSNAVLTQSDLQTVRHTPGVGTVLPLSVVPGSVQTTEVPTTSTPLVIATTSDAPTVLSQTVEYGEFFTPEEYSRNVAVIGYNLALSLFQTNAPLGQTFTFRGQQFIVSGVMNQFDSPPLSTDADFNNAIFIPYPIATQMEHNNAPLYEILAKPSRPDQTATLKQAITARLQAAHGGAKDFSVLTQKESLATTNNILSLMTDMISGVAAISLLVGGIGIMNVMLVSVTERTYEIGIRKAVGATNRQIRSQFLTEAIVLTVVGSVAAIIISVLINLLLRATTDLAPALSWQIMLISVAVAIIIGVIFGLAPAMKAARKEPIQALRHE